MSEVNLHAVMENANSVSLFCPSSETIEAAILAIFGISLPTAPKRLDHIEAFSNLFRHKIFAI